MYNLTQVALALGGKCVVAPQKQTLVYKDRWVLSIHCLRTNSPGIYVDIDEIIIMDLLRLYQQQSKR